MRDEDTLKKLQAELSHYQTVFDNCPMLIWFKDKNNNILKVNKLVADAAGLKPEDMANKSTWELYPNEADGYYADDLEVINSGKPKLGIIETMQTNEGKISVQTDKVPWRDEAGNICGVIVIVSDITQRKKYDEEIYKAQKLKSLGILAGGLAHDLNNLLGGIIGNIDLANLSIGEGKDCSIYLERIKPVVDKAKQLTQQLLTFAQGGAPMRAVISLEELVSDCISKFPTSAGTNIDFQVEASADLHDAHVDPVQIRQVINNLIVNAQQAMTDGGQIVISLKNTTATKPEHVSGQSKTAEYVQLSVEDNGHGIHPDIIENIFDPFFTTKNNGSGLGLSISHSIIKRHGGYIEVVPNVTKGSHFKVFLPVSAETGTNTSQSALISGDLKLRVLLMDDDAVLLDSLSGMLRALGCNFTCARDGVEAIKIFNEALKNNKAFDVVILDLTIPGGMGGKDTIRELRATKADFKSIVSSGYSNDPIMSSPTEFGFDTVLHKPFGLEELRRSLLKIL